MDDWLTTTEAGTALNKTRQWVVKLVKCGRLRAKYLGRDLRISPAEIKRFKQVVPVKPGPKPKA